MFFSWFSVVSHIFSHYVYLSYIQDTVYKLMSLKIFFFRYSSKGVLIYIELAPLYERIHMAINMCGELLLKDGFNLPVGFTFWSNWSWACRLWSNKEGLLQTYSISWYSRILHFSNWTIEIFGHHLRHQFETCQILECCEVEEVSSRLSS